MSDILAGHRKIAILFYSVGTVEPGPYTWDVGKNLQKFKIMVVEQEECG